MNKQSLDDEWKAWLKENIIRGCDSEELFAILLRNHFTVDSIRQEMGDKFPAYSKLLEPALQEEKSILNIDYRAIANVRLTRPDSGLNVFQVVSRKVQLYMLEDFMSGEECDKIADIAAHHLRPSTTTTNVAGYRTSSTCDLGLLHDPFADSIEEKIARTLGIRTSYSETNQAQRYEVGQEFKQHTDYFQPGTGEYIKFADDDRGQRTWTFMVYLNDVPRGGGTHFPEINKVFMPKKGRAIIWNNLFPDGTPNYNTLHAGLPVEEGYKTIITKWFREKGEGPMFYDD